jgi:hypothetical protein
LWHVFEASNLKKEATLEKVLNVKIKVMCLKNELHQAQTQVWQDALTIQALELAKSNFASMQSQWTIFWPKMKSTTLQDQLIVIQVNLDHL